MATANPNAYEGETMPLVEHLRELRNRLILSLIALFVCTLICLPFVESALIILTSQLNNPPIVINPTGVIVPYFKVSIIGGIALAMPIILYQITGFFLPALTKHEKRILYIFLPTGTLFFIAGVLFAAFVAMPFSLNFLQLFGEAYTQIQYTLDSYISFVTTMLLALGVAFQTPLVIYFVAKLGIVSYPTLVNNIRWAFLVTAIVAAVITPTPDPFTMLIVMAPLFLLYLLGVFLARFA